MRLTRRTGLVPAVLAALLSATACSSDAPSGTGDGPDLSGTLTVLAAASLTESFEELAHRFEAEHDGASVQLAFDSSATLAEQVNQGAPGDVIATADERTMRLVTDAGGTATAPEVFATNELVLVVPADNPAGIETLADLDTGDADYVVCVESAPCGALAAGVLDAAGVTAPPASEEVDVKAVLSKVELDEADAGLVYATDAVAAADRVQAIDVPAAGDAVNRYPIAAVTDAAEPDLAAAWVELVLSEEGRQVLGDAGFGAP